MPYVDVNGLQLYYEAAGNPAGPAVVLVAGLGVQMIDWPDYFIEPLIEAGCHVIRFDNRDIGLSTTFEGAPGDPHAVLAARLEGLEPDIAYTLGDMAADTIGLLDALDIERAHLVGVSMGGMIVQTAAIMFPDRVATLTSIMSTTGAADVGQPTPEAMAAILSASPSTERHAVIAHNIESAKVWASPGHFDEDRLRSLFEAAWDRVEGKQLLNGSRQFCAIVASLPRDEALKAVVVPALVVHGNADTLVPLTGGERTAACLPNAELVVIDGMGHDLQPVFAPGIASRIAQLVTNTVGA